MISIWALGDYPSMARLQREGLLAQANKEVIAEAEASLQRVHGNGPIPKIDCYHALELAAEKWLARHTPSPHEPNSLP